MSGGAESTDDPRASGSIPALRSRRYGLYVLSLLTAANFLHYGNRNVLFTMYEDLRETFAFSNSQIGLLGSAFMLSHALVTPLVGWAGDRLDRRRIIALGLAMWSAAGVASALATGFGSLFLSRSLVGLGTAVCVPLCNALLCEVFPQDEKARTVAIFNTGLFLGGVAGFGIGTLGHVYGMLIMALPGFLTAIFVFRLDVPARRASADASLSGHNFLAHAIELLRIPTMRWVMCGAVIMAFSAGSYQSWFFDFLNRVKGMTESESFGLLGLSMVGGLLGILCGGIVADRLQQRVSFGRLATISLGMVCTVPSALLAIYLDVGAMFYVTSWLTMFFIFWYHGPMAAVVDDLAIDDRAATAQAVVIFTMHLLGTAPSSWVMGEIADIYGLERAMLMPTLGVLLAAVILAGGWRSMAGDVAKARAGSGQASSRAL